MNDSIKMSFVKGRGLALVFGLLSAGLTYLGVSGSEQAALHDQLMTLAAGATGLIGGILAFSSKIREVLRTKKK